MITQQTKYVLQLCHDYSMPYLDVARQYASLFKNTQYQCITVYLVGDKDDQVVQQTNSDKVLFLENSSKDIRGLKLKQIHQIKHICQQYCFEFAIGHRYKAIYILKHVPNLPVLGIHHSFDVYSRFTRRWFVNRHSKDLYLLGVSNAIRDNIKYHLPHYPHDQIHTLYNRINIEQVKSKQVSRFEAREYLGLDQNSYIFANVGRLHPDKDQKTLINAFAKVADSMPNALLVILGKGRLKEELQQHVRILGLTQRILFLGVIKNAVYYFKAFDSFVLSSYCEPFGMVLLEAIMADIPVISSETGGTKEIITNPKWRFSMGNHQQLAQLLQQSYTLTDAQKQTTIVENQQHLQQNFTDGAVRQAFWGLPFMKKLQKP